MRRVLLTALSFLVLTTNVTQADHLGVYSDASGASCSLVSGFTSTTAVIHKFSIGARGSRIKLEFPPGSSFLQFNSPHAMTGSMETGAVFNYGECLQGSFVVGSMYAILMPGILWVRPADGFASVMAIDCDMVEHPGSCGGAYVDDFSPYCPYCDPVATAHETWGAVKALYR